MNTFMIKPTSYHCNIDCDYCFYLEKEAFMKTGERITRQTAYMSIDKAKEFVIKRLEASAEEVTFTWQGGEPLMMGVDFFREVFTFARSEANRRGQKIQHAIQTNGILINPKWAQLFQDFNVLIGISIDGDKELHDRYRVSCSGKGTFDKVMKGISILKNFNIEFNTLTVVNSVNSRFPLKVYKFLRELGSRYMQFIPCVEIKELDDNYKPVWMNDKKGESSTINTTEFTVDPIAYADFMIAIFHEWSRHDVANISIRLFDSYLSRFFGYQSSECIFRKKCGGQNLALEANGDIYQCDHFVYPEEQFKVGNVETLDFNDINDITVWLDNKKEDLPQQCENCNIKELCFGGCPKHRFVSNKDGEKISYFCPSYKKMIKELSPGFNLIREFAERGLPLELIPGAMMELYPHIKAEAQPIFIQNIIN